MGIAQDMTIYLGRAESGRELTFEQESGRRIFIYLIEGQVKLPDDQLLQPGDSARIEGISRLALASEADTLVMVIDLP
ncbi:hypothetical protein D3C71_2139640 [compost metagenome]